MARRDEDAVAAALGDRLRAADAAIEVPDGLWTRTRAAVPAPARRHRARPLVVALAAVVVAAVALGSWLIARPDAAAPPAGAPAATVTVFNVERACRGPRTADCGLRVAADPRARYAAPDNRAGVVFHGDRLTATCALDGGTTVRDETGHASSRWYLVRGAHALRGWLPAVRTRSTVDLPACTDAQVPGSR